MYLAECSWNWSWSVLDFINCQETYYENLTAEKTELVHLKLKGLYLAISKAPSKANNNTEASLIIELLSLLML